MKRTHLIIIIALAVVLCIGAIVLINSQRETEAAPDWQHHYDIGMRFLSQGNYQEAVIAFRAAIEINPRQADAYLGLADAYIGLGDIDTAIAILRQGYDLTGDAQLLERIAELEQIKILEESTSDTAMLELDDELSHTVSDNNETRLPISREYLRYPTEFRGIRGRQTMEYDSNGFLVRFVEYQGYTSEGLLEAFREETWTFDDAAGGWQYNRIFRTSIPRGGHGGFIDGIEYDDLYDGLILQSRFENYRSRGFHQITTVFGTLKGTIDLERSPFDIDEDGRVYNSWFNDDWFYAIYQFDEFGNAIFITSYDANGDVLGYVWIEWGVIQ